MAITRLATSSLKTGTKYDDFLAGNAAFIPSNFFSIATVTAAGGETSLSFTSIPSTYTHLQIRGIAKDTYNTANDLIPCSIQFNGDSGANYAYHILQGNGTSAVVNGVANRTYTLAYLSVRASGGTNYYAVSIMDIADYTNTFKNKTIKVLSGIDENTATTAHSIVLSSGLWVNTAAITSISIFAGQTAFAAGSTFALYGVK